MPAHERQYPRPILREGLFMEKMSEDFQKRQKPVAALIIGISAAIAGAAVTLVRKLMGGRK
ncbi:hypothetical protein AA0472_0763 [Acetobacter estunensis NRIC 0472]|nr:hypothetical protein AA0472_0763 [Acetobacter estunensis NRIC 0472]